MGENGKPKRTSKLPIFVPCEKVTVKHHGGIWNPIKKNGKIETEISTAAFLELFEML